MSDTPDQPIPPTPIASALPPSLASQIENLTKVLQSTLTLVVGAGALLSASGFIIVNTALASFSDIQVYNILPAQFLSAGALWLVVLAIIFVPLFRVFEQIAKFVVSFWISFRASFVFSFDRAAHGESREQIDEEVKALQQDSIERTIRAFRSRPFVIVIAIFTALVGSVIYGQGLYLHLPRAIGGGRPTSVMLVFDKPENLQVLGLTSAPGAPRQTGSLLLLAELTDGMLVADTSTGRIVAVKNDYIVARMNAQIAPQIITPTPKQAVTPTAAATAAP